MTTIIVLWALVSLPLCILLAWVARGDGIDRDAGIFSVVRMDPVAEAERILEES
jgi:hypothetical protein